MKEKCTKCHVFSEGDIVYVSNPDLACEEEQPRFHRNFFGKVIEVDNSYVIVDFDNDDGWSYEAKELSLAKELRHMTLEDFSNTFGVCVNATFL